MDNKTHLEELKNWVRAFCDERGWDEPHTGKDLAIGLVTELLEIFRFVPREKEQQLLQTEREHIADELADSLYFLLRFSERYGFDLTQALSRKLEKNALRYPKKNS